MANRRSPSVNRKPRADAQRNREHILEVAKQEFTRSGADTSLDDIAKQAGVGPGTLYRHFPTREALLKTVYRTEMERDRKSTRLNSSHGYISYAVFCLKKKNKT